MKDAVLEVGTLGGDSRNSGGDVVEGFVEGGENGLEKGVGRGGVGVEGYFAKVAEDAGDEVDEITALGGFSEFDDEFTKMGAEIEQPRVGGLADGVGDGGGKGIKAKALGI